MPTHYRIVGSGRRTAPERRGLPLPRSRGARRVRASRAHRGELGTLRWQPVLRARLHRAARRAAGCGRAAERELGVGIRRLIYLAAAPDAFGPMVQMLSASGLAKGERLIIEKPFGGDLAFACTLNKTLHSVFENRIFRIDHDQLR